jgi:hypothetical protein
MTKSAKMGCLELGIIIGAVRGRFLPPTKDGYMVMAGAKLPGFGGKRFPNGRKGEAGKLIFFFVIFLSLHSRCCALLIIDYLSSIS